MAPKGSQITKVGPNGPKMQQTTLKPPQKAHNPTQCLLQAFPRNEYPSGTLRGPSKATQYPSGHSFTLRVALKGLGRAKKGQRFKWAQNGPNGLQLTKIAFNWLKIGQNGQAPSKSTPPAFPRHEYPSGSLRGPSKATQYPSGHSFTLWVALKGLGRAKKGPMGLFGPSKATIVLNSRPKGVKIGQNGSKCCPNC